MNDMVSLYELILDSAKAGRELQRKDGSMPAGNNGPWNDKETPVRNTSHWLVTFLKAYDITKDTKYKTTAQRAADYLTTEEARPYGKTFHHRKSPDKDACNGLIGQAWTIEALAIASKDLSRPDLLDLAESVFLLHPFNEQFGLWRPVDIDGKVNSHDMTFNHQLWFAAAGSLLQSDRVQSIVRSFLDSVDRNLSIYKSGLIRHKVDRGYPVLDNIRYLSDSDSMRFGIRKYKSLIRQAIKQESKSNLRYRSVGYHSFNTYALAVLKNEIPDHSIWQSNKVQKSIDYITTDKYKMRIQDNKYAYPYNPPGIENAYTLHVFGEESEDSERSWVSEQVQKTFNFKTGLMEAVDTDPRTYAARVYEATRLPDYELSINK